MVKRFLNKSNSHFIYAFIIFFIGLKSSIIPGAAPDVTTPRCYVCKELIRRGPVSNFLWIEYSRKQSAEGPRIIDRFHVRCISENISDDVKFRLSMNNSYQFKVGPLMRYLHGKFVTLAIENRANYNNLELTERQLERERGVNEQLQRENSTLYYENERIHRLSLDKMNSAMGRRERASRSAP